MRTECVSRLGCEQQHTKHQCKGTQVFLLRIAQGLNQALQIMERNS